MTIHQLPANAYQVPHIDQLLGPSPMAMLPESFDALTRQLLAIDIAQHLANYKSMDSGKQQGASVQLRIRQRWPRDRTADGHAT
jgi:hypothetical protein